MDAAQRKRTLCIKVKHVGSYVAFPGRPKKVAIGIYAGVLSPPAELLFLGWRWITNTEGLFAACIDEGLNELFPVEDCPALDVLVENDGFKKYLTEYVPTWISNGGVNSEGKVPDQYEHWKSVYLQFALSRVHIAKPSTSETKGTFDNIDAYLDLIGQVALQRLEGNQSATPQHWSGGADDFTRWFHEIAGVVEMPWRDPAG